MQDDRSEFEKTQREVLRWRILQALNIGRPYPLREDTILQAVAGSDMPIKQFDLRRELDYLERRQLLEIKNRGMGPWEAELTRHGIDLAEYEIECEPGIARPPTKYW